jgi:hypothetical protein
MLLEGAGHRQDGRPTGRAPVDLLMQAQCSGNVPVLTAVLGPSAGHGALIAPMSDFAVMSQQASVFTAGPPVVAESLGEVVTKDELGGPGTAVASGLIHNVGNDDAATLDLLRIYLSYFPSSAWEYPPHYASDDAAPRDLPELLNIIPRDGRRTYDVRDVIDVVFDDESWFEVQPGFGPQSCALARLGGDPVAVVANNPSVLAGSIDVDAADKAAHFISVADSFHLPLVFLTDNPGVMPGSASERRGILRSGARMFAAQTAATTIKFEITMRKAYGFGSMVMGMMSFNGQSGVFVSAATMGDGRIGDGPLTRFRRRRSRAVAHRRAAGVVQLGDELRLRRDDRSRDTRNVLLDARSAKRRRQSPAARSRAMITPDRRSSDHRLRSERTMPPSTMICAPFTGAGIAGEQETHADHVLGIAHATHRVLRHVGNHLVGPRLRDVGRERSGSTVLADRRVPRPRGRS